MTIIIIIRKKEFNNPDTHIQPNFELELFVSDFFFLIYSYRWNLNILNLNSVGQL